MTENRDPGGTERSDPDDWNLGADWPPRATRHVWADAPAAAAPGHRQARRGLRRGVIAAVLVVAALAVTFLVTRPSSGPGTALPLTSEDATLSPPTPAPAHDTAARFAELLSTGLVDVAAESVCVADRKQFVETFAIPAGWQLAMVSGDTVENGDSATAQFWLTGTEIASGESTTTTLTQTFVRNDGGRWVWCSGRLGPADAGG